MAHSIGLDYTVFDSQQNFSFVSVDPDSQYSVEGQTPLIAAAFAGNSDIIEFLLRNGASIDAKDSAGCTALTRAVCLQHTSAVQKLLIAGADPTIGTTTGANALHFACANGNVPIVEHLLAHIQPESLETSVSGFSPLALCAAAGHIECVKVLCSAITSANIKQVALDIPLKAAAEGSQQHIIETITTYFEPCIGSRTVQPALLSASRSGDVVIVKQLLKFVQGDVHELHGSFNEAAKHGHIIVMDLLWTHYNGRRLAEQYCPPSGWITLVLAAEAGQANTVRFLLDKGFQADVGTADGFTPLMASAKHGHLSIVQDLLAAGASPNSATSAGDSALILATRYGHASIVRELLGSGSDFNAKTVTGDLTALLFASKNGSGALIQLLLGHGAPLETCAANGFTPLLLAVQGGHAEAVRIILDAGANPDKSSESETKDFWRSRDSTRTPLELAVEGAHTEIVDLLLKQGADTETTGSRWETALEIAASSGHKDIVAHLLDAGALRLQEAFNKAYHKNHEDIIGLLTIQGVEFTHPHDAHVYWHGRWPLLPQDTALSTDLDLRVTTTTWTEWPDDFEIAESGNIEDVHQYLDAGGDVDVAHSNGHTALLSAVANDYQDIVALLLANGADCNIEIDGCTALLLAAGNGNHQIVAELITFGADTRFRSCGDRWDAYALAAFHGHVRVLEVLFDAIGETFPEYEDRYRFRDSHCLPKDAIFDAASNGHSDMVKFLLSRGIYDEFAAPTLYSNAALNGHIAVICVLVHAGADYLYAHDEDGPYHGPWSPLVAAASRGHAEIVALLLGLSPSFPDRAKAEAFSGACDNQHIAVLQELLRVGMNLEQFFLGVDPLLISAVKCGDSSVLDVLLEASSGKTTAGLFRSSPVTDAIDSSSTAALHHAAHDGRSDMVAALLNAGASKDLQDGNGWTALMHACHKSHEDVARLLLRQDCRTDCIDSVGRSALSLACTNGLSLVVERLIKAGADISSGVALVQAVRQNRLEVVQILLLAGVNVDIQTEDGWSALPEAARLNSLQMVQLLLAGGADTETAFKSGWTALAFVARDGHHDIVDTLLVAGADPNTTVSNSYTPLSLAARGGHLQTVMSMLTHTRSSMFTTGSTLALEEAARHGYEGICSALLDKFGRCSNARLACATAAKRAEVNNHTKVAETIHQHEDLWRAQSCEGKHEHDICEVSPELALRELQRSIGPTKEDKIDSIQPSIELTHAMAYGSVVSGNPLFLAIETADNAAAMHLLDSGESVATGDCGITALHVACRSGNRQIVEVLVNRGTDVNVQTTTIEPLERLMRETFPEGVPKDLRQPVDVAYLSDAREKCPGMDANLCESCMTLIPSINDFVLEHETPAREEIFTTPQILFSAIKGCPGCAMAFQFIRTLFGRATLTSDPIYRQVELHNTWKVDDLQNILFARSMFSSRHNKNRTFEFDEEGLGIGDIRPREWQNRFNPRKVVDGSLSWDFQTLLIKYSVPKDLPQLCKYIVYADEGK
jgi:ankyrin repeat protein